MIGLQSTNVIERYKYILPHPSLLKSTTILLCLSFILQLPYHSITAQAYLENSPDINNTQCDNLRECYQNRLLICQTSVTQKSQEVFQQNIPDFLRYMDAINEKSIWLEGLTTIAKGYLSFREYTKADSTYRISLLYTATTEQTIEIQLERTKIKQRIGKSQECIDLSNYLLNTLDSTSITYPKAYLTRGICYLDAQEIVKAIEDLMRVKELTQGKEELKFQYDKAEEFLVKTYTELNSFESSLEIYQDKRKSSHDKGDFLEELFSYYHILNALLKLKKYEETIKVARQAIHLKRTQKVTTAFGFVYHCMSESFLEMNQLDSALYYANKGIQISRDANEQKELADNLSTLGKILIKNKEYEKANNVVAEGMALRNYHDITLYDVYATTMANLGQHEKAYIALRSNWEIWQDRHAITESSKIASLLVEERFRIEHKQQIQNIQHERNSEKMWIAIVALSIFVVLFGAFLRMQMQNNHKLEKLNYSLSHHNQALEQFAHITSHDLKEPVRNISSFASLLLRKIKSKKIDDEQLEYLTFIKDNATNLYRMIESIKKFTEVSFNNKESENIKVAEIFDTVRQNLRQLISENNTKLVFHNPQSIEFVQFPKDLLIVTLQNIVQNGIKYNQSHRPKIDVTIKEHGQQTTFKISDNGIGIDKEFQTQIFIPFKTLDNKVNTQSSGLGLSICKNILENHGGKIWVESDGRSGSNFYFSF